MDAKVIWPEAPCCQPGDSCVCGPMERVLRAYCDGVDMPAMTKEQREECLRQIDSAEGYEASEHANESDRDLSRTVIGAWTEYCRDQGLI